MHPPKSIYDIHKSYLENLNHGPFYKDKLPIRLYPSKDKWVDFLGFKAASRIGIFAGPLLNSKWIKLGAELGYDLLVYKTIRSSEHPGLELPNIIYIDQKKPLDPHHLPASVRQRKNEPPLSEISITNSFGMPSRSPEYLKKDIPASQNYLSAGQHLIVSITGTPTAPFSKEQYLEDFKKAALLAKEAGAKIIEANFSCPNVSQAEGALYLHPEDAYEAASYIVDAIGDCPLIIKVGAFPSKQLLNKALLALSLAGARAVSGINSLSLNVVNDDDMPALGHNRLKSGVCGLAIREAALKFVEDSRSIIDQEKLPLALIGGGGILSEDHFDLFLNRGADFVFTATGMMWDPHLAIRYHTLKSKDAYAFK